MRRRCGSGPSAIRTSPSTEPERTTRGRGLPALRGRSGSASRERRGHADHEHHHDREESDPREVLGERRREPVVKEHLQAYEQENHTERGPQVGEAVEHVCEHEVEAPQAEDRHDVAAEDEERILGDGEHRWDGVHGEHHVGELHHDERVKQEGAAPLAVRAAGEERRADVHRRELGRGGDAKHAPQEDDARALLGIEVGAATNERLQAGVDEERAEQLEHPVEARDERGPRGDHRASHADRPDDSPEQHTVLVLLRYAQEPEDQRDHEDVVDGERLLDDVGGQVRHRGVGAGGAGPAARQAAPAGAIRQVDHAREADAERDPERGPPDGLARRDPMRAAMEDAEIERQQGAHEQQERGVDPDHRRSVEDPASTGRAARAQARSSRMRHVAPWGRAASGPFRPRVPRSGLRHRSAR